LETAGIQAIAITLGLVRAMAGSQRMATMSLGLFLLAGTDLLAKVQPVSDGVIDQTL
jgi:hypothetical protein